MVPVHPSHSKSPTIACAFSAHTAKLTPQRAVDGAQLRAQFLINPERSSPLPNRYQVGFAQRGQKRIGIPCAAGFALIILDDEIIGIDLSGVLR